MGYNYHLKKFNFLKNSLGMNNKIGIVDSKMAIKNENIEFNIGYGYDGM